MNYIQVHISGFTDTQMMAVLCPVRRVILLVRRDFSTECILVYILACLYIPQVLRVSHQLSQRQQESVDRATHFGRQCVPADLTGIHVR